MKVDYQHFEPVWRHKANFIVEAKVLDPDYAEEHPLEQLWTRKLPNGLHELCCIPFTIYNMFLADIVQFDLETGDFKVMKSGGHYGFRVATNNDEQQDSIRGKMYEIGVLTERYSSKLMAVDAEDLTTAQQVADILQDAEDEGSIMAYETIKK